MVLHFILIHLSTRLSVRLCIFLSMGIIISMHYSNISISQAKGLELYYFINYICFTYNCFLLQEGIVSGDPHYPVLHSYPQVKLKLLPLLAVLCNGFKGDARVLREKNCNTMFHDWGQESTSPTFLSGKILILLSIQCYSHDYIQIAFIWNR